MFDKFATIVLVDQPSHRKTPRMFSNSFFIRIECSHYIVQGRPVVICDKKQNLNPVMVCHPLQMPFHLFCCFFFYHNYIIYHILTFSSLLACYLGKGWVGEVVRGYWTTRSSCHQIRDCMILLQLLWHGQYRLCDEVECTWCIVSTFLFVMYLSHYVSSLLG